MFSKEIIIATYSQNGLVGCLHYSGTPFTLSSYFICPWFRIGIRFMAKATIKLGMVRVNQHLLACSNIVTKILVLYVHEKMLLYKYLNELVP